MVEMWNDWKLSAEARAALLETEVIYHVQPNHVPVGCVVEFEATVKGVYIHGARLYSKTNRYLGWWPRYAIPRAVILDWAGQIQEESVQTRKVFQDLGKAQDTLEHQ